MPHLIQSLRLFKATLVALAVSALTIWCGSVALADTITVTSDQDTEVAGDGVCTLREAFTNANNDSDSTATDCAAGNGADTIEFNIGGGGAQAISLANALPVISTPMHIDGSSQPGYAGTPLIHVDYSNNALFLAGASSTMVEALDLSWSGPSRSGTGLRVNLSSAITVTNVIATNRSFGITFDANNTDVWVLNNDLTDNNTALYLNVPLSGILPGGMQISGNNYADSGTGISIASAQDVVVSDGSAPGTNVLVAPADGLTAATTALRFNWVSNSTVTGLDVSWSGGSRSGTGLLLAAGSLITVTNTIATNRTTGASFSGITDFWVEGNDLSNNGTALSVNSPISGILPGGMQISNNKYADSGVGILINSTQDVTVSDGSAPGTNVLVAAGDGLMDTSGYALRFNQVSNGLVTELDLSWPGGARSGTALGVTGSSLITVTNVAATNRVTGIAFNGITDVWLEGNDLSGNTTALSLVNVQQGVLPGGLWVADNSYVDSVIGLSIQTAQDVIVSDGSTPGTNVVVAPTDGLTATAGVALNFYQVNNAMVTGLDFSWSGGSRSGTGLQVRASSLITTANLTANNRVTGILFSNNNTDLWVENNDLSNNTTALNLSNTLPGVLPGGMWVSSNNYADSGNGLSISSAQDLIVSDGSAPGTNVVVVPGDGLTTASVLALNLNQINNAMVTGLDLSWSGASHSGTGLQVRSSSLITIANVTVTDRLLGITFNNNTDIWVEDNVLAGNNTALNLSDTLSGVLPGGMWVSGNNYADSGIGLAIQSAQNVTASDGSAPGTNVVIAPTDGLDTAGTALSFNQVTNGTVTGLDLSKSGTSPLGIGLSVQDSDNITVSTLIVTDRSIGITFSDVTTSQATCSYLGNNLTGIVVDNDFTGLAIFDNYISGNTSAGLSNNEITTLSAANNYWGAADGPSTDGGSGDAYGGAISAAPFSTAPASCLNEIVDWDSLPTSYGDTVHIRTDTLQVGAGGILDDGATFPALPAAGIYTASITVTNISGQAAQLVGWIDLNGNGVFEQPDERSSSNLVNGSGAAADGTFTTGNIPNGVVDALAILQWTVAGPPVVPTYARTRLTTDAEFFSDASPQPSGGYGAGESEVHTVSTGTVPVTVGYFLAQPAGDGIEFHWQTATETGTAGFNILAVTEAGAVQLNPALIPSQAIDSTEPLDYAFIAQTNATSFLLQEVEITGATNEYGPYTLGNAYGAHIPTDPVDGWSIYLPFITTR
ncbi:MAG: hypothetical protein KDD78_13270 [Caldilineaceae bacterium]|nr:hypothetical protein [Caldilineaceae bacterium]